MGERILKGKVVPLRTIGPRFGQLFLDIFNRNLDKIVVIDADSGEKLTYRQLKKSCIQFSLWLRQHGVSSSDNIAFISDNNSIHEVVPMISSFMEGILHSIWYHTITLDEARYCVSLFQPKVIVSRQKTLDLLKLACELEKCNSLLVSLDPSVENDSYFHLESIIADISEDKINGYQPNEIDDLNKSAFVIFTSGSTGKPKGVVHSYLSVLNNFVLDLPTKSTQLIMLWYTVPSWITWSIFYFSIIYNGGIRILHREFSVDETPKIIQKYQVNCIFLDAMDIYRFVMSQVIENLITYFTSVEHFLTGSSIIDAKVFDKFKNSIGSHIISKDYYGISETTASCVMEGYMKRENITAFSLGFPLPNVQIKVVDEETGRSLGPNESGEILIKKPIVFTEYYKNPGATEAAFDSEGWYHTGDIGFYDQNEELFFLDRIKDMIKFERVKILPSEIRNVLITHPAIVDAVILPISDMTNAEVPMAFVVKKPNMNVTEEELIALSSTLGDDRKLRGGIKFLDDFPRTINKKINKGQLRIMTKEYERQYKIIDTLRNIFNER